VYAQLCIDTVFWEFKVLTKQATLAGHTTGSDPMLLHRTWLPKLNIKIEVLKANVVAMSISSTDANHTRPPTRIASASAQRAEVVRQSQMGSYPRSVARDVQAVL
jgi:hypothetical protein